MCATRSHTARSNRFRQLFATAVVEHVESLADVLSNDDLKPLSGAIVHAPSAGRRGCAWRVGGLRQEGKIQPASVTVARAQQLRGGFARSLAAAVASCAADRAWHELAQAKRFEASGSSTHLCICNGLE